MSDLTIRSAKNVIFGCGTRSRLGEHASPLGKRALVVCGTGAPDRGNTIEELIGGLAGSGVESALFAQVEAEPSLQTVESGRAALREAACGLVVAIGGGSAMDVGKAIGALAGTEEPVSTFFSGAPTPGRGVAVIALPTTSGTGAEVTPNSVLSDPESGEKASIRGEGLLPEVAIVDPELTLTLPPAQTAYSGLDALVQAIEAYTSIGANAFSDPLAEEATVRIAGSLVKAFDDGSDLAAREDMALGSLFAGLALASARLGLVHGLAHPIGILYHLPHGQVCGMLMPYVMEYNLEAARDRYAHLAQSVGAGSTACDLLHWFRDVSAQVGLPDVFGPFGLTEADFEAIIPPTLASGSSKHNPRKVTEEGLREMLPKML